MPSSFPPYCSVDSSGYAAAPPLQPLKRLLNSPFRFPLWQMGLWMLPGSGSSSPAAASQSRLSALPILKFHF